MTPRCFCAHRVSVVLRTKRRVILKSFKKRQKREFILRARDSWIVRAVVVLNSGVTLPTRLSIFSFACFTGVKPSVTSSTLNASSEVARICLVIEKSPQISRAEGNIRLRLKSSSDGTVKYTQWKLRSPSSAKVLTTACFERRLVDFVGACCYDSGTQSVTNKR